MAKGGLRMNMNRNVIYAIVAVVVLIIAFMVLRPGTDATTGSTTAPATTGSPAPATPAPSN
jgi:hypothetical protein